MIFSSIGLGEGCISVTGFRVLKLAVIVSVLFATASGRSARANQTSSGSIDAIRGVVAALHEHPLVLVGEDHWLQQAGDSYIALIRDRGFQDAVQDIVVEFASRNGQALLDRYIAGEDVPFTEVEHIWRNTTKVASWESPIYANWLAAIRRVNKNLPASRRKRVLAGDTPIDCQRIHTHAEWAALGDNNVSFADIITSEVLAKRHHALVALGASHATKSSTQDEAANTTSRVESRFPGSTFVVLLDYWGLVTPETQAKIDSRGQSPPVFYTL
jgi:hypothetical protein